VLVSPDTSDIYFANQLIKNLNVVGVIVEKQREKVNVFTKLLKIPLFLFKPWLLVRKISKYLIMKPYSEMCANVDFEHFGEEGKELFLSKNCKAIYTEGKNALNEEVYVEEIKKLKPDLIAVCGASILKKPIISIPNKGTLNLHGGLPQKYRGIYTTLWAVYNQEPEYIGPTVHYVNEKIDDGNIIYQGRPNISIEDNPETLYVKVVKLGVKMMIRAISDIENNKVKDYPLEENGSLYLLKMVTPEIIKKAMKNIDGGVIAKYIKEKSSRDKKVIPLMRGVYVESGNCEHRRK